MPVQRYAGTPVQNTAVLLGVEGLGDVPVGRTVDEQRYRVFSGLVVLFHRIFFVFFFLGEYSYRDAVFWVAPIGVIWEYMRPY